MISGCKFHARVPWQRASPAATTNGDANQIDVQNERILGTLSKDLRWMVHLLSLQTHWSVPTFLVSQPPCEHQNKSDHNHFNGWNVRAHTPTPLADVWPSIDKRSIGKDRQSNSTTSTKLEKNPWNLISFSLALCQHFLKISLNFVRLIEFFC